MIVAATSTPIGSELPENSTSNASTDQAVSIAATKPRYIANPPMSGSGLWCTVRSFGRYTQPRRRASIPTNGVVADVTTAATAPISRKEPSSGTMVQPRTASVGRVGGEPGTELGDVLADEFEFGRVVPTPQRPGDECSDQRHLGLGHSLRGDRRCADTHTTRDERAARVVGDGVLVQC